MITSLKAAIIDDEENVRELVEKMCAFYFPELEVVAKADDVETGIAAIARHAPNLIFLDIRLGNGTGFDLLQHFPSPSFKIIFITAYDHYAVQAFKFSALDYLLKPLDPDLFCSAIEKAKQSLEKENLQLKLEALLANLTVSQKEHKKMVLKTAETLYVIQVAEIIRCEASNNYTTFYLLDGRKLLVSTTLKEYEECLQDLGFFRTHQSHLINLDFLERFDKRDGGVVILRDKSMVPVAQRKKEQLLQKLSSLCQ